MPLNGPTPESRELPSQNPSTTGHPVANSSHIGETNKDVSKHTLAIQPTSERTYPDAHPTIDLEAIERLCRVWGEVVQAILDRRRTRVEK